jgi:hypothetical protein
MSDMSHIRVETWRTARQMPAYRFIALRRPACQNLEHVIWWAALAFGIGESLPEIGTGEIEEILFVLKDSTFLGSGYH